MKKELCIIFDISSLLYRSLYSKADSDLQNPVARKTLAYILNVIGDHFPDYIAICIDGNRDEIYRKKLDSGYKSNRKERPKEITDGLNTIKEFCKMFEIKTVEVPEQESDDLVASIVKKMEENGVYNIVVTGDGDLCQLHSKKTKIAKLTKDNIKVLKTWNQVKENFGKILVDSPEQVVDYLGLTGDASDGIKSPVPRLGKKRALDLINKYGSIRNMFASEDELPYNVRNYENEIFKTRNLVKLYNKIELPEIDEFRYGRFDYDKTLEWMIDHNLASKLFNNIIDLDF